MEKEEYDIVRTFRVPEDLWRSFRSLCKEQDTTATREIRKFVRRYVASQGQKQMDLGHQ